MEQDTGVSGGNFVAPDAPEAEPGHVVAERHQARLQELVGAIGAALPSNGDVAKVEELLGGPLDTTTDRDQLFQRLSAIDNTLDLSKRWITKEVITILRELGVTP